jgi:hypothetical protein
MDAPAFFTVAQDYGFTDLSNATLLQALQSSVDSIERVRPWPFLEATATLAFNGVSGISTTTAPRIRAVLRAKDLLSGGTPKPMRMDDFEDLVGTSYTTVGTPQVYTMEAGVLSFWPIPAASCTIKLRYLQWSARLTETSPESAFLIPARHHEAILFGMLRRLYDQQDDPELAATMGEQRDRLLIDMVEDLTKWQYDEPDFVRLLDPNDW